jgi:hypothetical protein
VQDAAVDADHGDFSGKESTLHDDRVQVAEEDGEQGEISED